MTKAAVPTILVAVILIAVAVVAEAQQRSCPRHWKECILNGKDWDVMEATHQAYQRNIAKIAKR
jgi:hypothetical protein